METKNLESPPPRPILTQQQEVDKAYDYFHKINSKSKGPEDKLPLVREFFDWISFESTHLLRNGKFVRTFANKIKEFSEELPELKEYEFPRMITSLSIDSTGETINPNLFYLLRYEGISPEDVSIPILARLCRRFVSEDSTFFSWLRLSVDQHLGRKPILSVDKARKAVEVFALNRTTLDCIDKFLFLELCVILGPIFDRDLFEWLKTF